MCRIAPELGDVLRAVRMPLDERAEGPIAALATLSGDLHGLGLQMCALVVAVAGWRPLVLGVNTPIPQIVALTREAPIAAVAVSCAPPRRRHTAEALRELRVVNSCRDAEHRLIRAEGRARLAHRRGPASRLKVRFAPKILSFLPMVWGDYWILDLTGLAPHESGRLKTRPKRTVRRLQRSTRWTDHGRVAMTPVSFLSAFRRLWARWMRVQ